MDAGRFDPSGADPDDGDPRLTDADAAAVSDYLTTIAPREGAVRDLPAAEVAHRRSVLVKPPGYDRALLTLHIQHRVVVVGPAGTGRESAGLGLLADTGGEVDVTLVRDPTRADVAEYEFGAGCRVLVEVRTPAGDSRAELATALTALLGRVQKAAGYVVVLAEPGLPATVLESRESYTCAIEAAPALQVLTAHLRGLGASSEVLAAVADSPAVRDFCAGARPGLAARLAVQLAGESDRSPDSELATRLSRTVRDFARFGNEVTARFDAADRFGKGPDAGDATRTEPAPSAPVREADSLELERSLLLSAALAENLSLGALQIEDLLLDRLGRPTQAHPLGRVGFGVRLRRLGHLVRGDDGRVRFGQPSHSIDLLCHVWLNYPHLRSGLSGWVRSIPDSAALSLERAERLAVVEQFVRACDQLNAAAYVTDLVGAWASGRRESRLAAIVALSAAALSWTIGGDVRQQLVDWARAEGTSEARQDLVLRTCAGPFARQYPRVALTCLGELAARPEPIGPRARQAIVELAADAPVRPHVVEGLAEWCGAARRELSAELLDALLSAPGWEPHAATPDRNRVRAGLVDLARRALDERGTDATTQITSGFLEHGIRGDADAAVAILVDAARGSGPRLSRLAWAAAEWFTDRRWDVDSAARRSLYERVAASVDELRSASERHVLPDPRGCGA